MTTPNQFSFHAVHKNPNTPKEHADNWQALERWARDLPFLRSHRHNVEEDVEIVPSDSQVFDLYPSTGYYPNEPGTFQSIITVMYQLVGTPGIQSVGVEAIRDLELLGLTPGFPRLEERHPESLDIPIERVMTFQAFYTMARQPRRWEPQIEFFNGAGNPDLLIQTISVLHMFWPEGLTNTLLFQGAE